MGQTPLGIAEVWIKIKQKAGEKDENNTEIDWLVNRSISISGGLSTYTTPIPYFVHKHMPKSTSTSPKIS